MYILVYVVLYLSYCHNQPSSCLIWPYHPALLISHIYLHLLLPHSSSMYRLLVLSLKGPLLHKVDTAMTPQVQRDVDALARSPPVKTTSGIDLLTPSIKRSSSMYSSDSSVMATPKRIQHNIPHRFMSGLNTRATKCSVCLGSVPFAKQASKCQGKRIKIITTLY